MWIYKHKLFHRDRPDDLHRVRRRTCPGVDGRKQRFSRFSARKLNQFDDSKSPQSSDDESSLEETSVEESDERPSSKKRLMENDDHESHSSKRTRRLWNSSKFSDNKQDEDIKIDTSIVSHSVPSPTSVFEAHESLVRHDSTEADDDLSTNRRNDRLEMIEQSIVVSEVATKLEEFARKALRGRGGSRTRRNGGGVVTPPFGSSRQYSISSRGLLTYDDEIEDNSGVVTDGDDSSAGEDGSFAGGADTSHSVKAVQKAFLVAPVCDTQTVKSITECILSASTYQTRGTMIATSAVARFCMTTPPNDDGSLAEKILELISSCDKLAYEFQLYRGALRPGNCLGESISLVSSDGLEDENSGKLPEPSSKDDWDRDTSRNDAVRDFKTFAVNCIQKVLLRKNGGFGDVPFIDSEASKLQYTADIWLKSVGMNS